MRNLVTLLVLGLLFCHGLVMAMAYREEKEGRERGGRRGQQQQQQEEEEEGRGVGEDWFLLQNSKQVVKTDAGDMIVVRSNIGGRVLDRPLHIGFITMEPQSLFVPQYIDSSLILFVRRGQAIVGSIYKDDFVERILRIGDVYRIPAGSAFYLVNTGEGQRLHIICSIDPSEGLGLRNFQSFFIGGGTYPSSVLAGFGHETLTNAFNVTREQVDEILTRQTHGPIVPISDSHSPSMWSKFLQMKEQDKQERLKRMVESEQEPQQEGQVKWSWRKLLDTVFRTVNKRGDKGSTDTYNIYDRSPDFRNNYGWSIAVDESDYRPLKHSGIGVYLVNLTAGSMMAPHVNPTATEYGIVLRGTGRIQVVFPNGTAAMNTQVREGDVFWVPRYFPFCQIASRTGPFEFFGFTTSARRNRPQFLVGSSSVLRSLPNPELAAAFGVSEDRMRNFTEAQREAVILPTAGAAPPDKEEEQKIPVVKFKGLKNVVTGLGKEMVMDFD